MGTIAWTELIRLWRALLLITDLCLFHPVSQNESKNRNWKKCSVTLEENIKGTDQKSIAADDNFVIDVWCNTAWKGPPEIS